MQQLYEEITLALSGNDYDYEIIFINDGSSDATEDKAVKLCSIDKKVRLINFKRNMGQTSAILAGFDHATGDYIVTLDADLQNDPADIPRMMEYAISNGYDIVSGYRQNRKDPFLTRILPSKIANILISKISEVKLKDFGCTLKVYNKDSIANLRLYGDMHRFIPVIASWRGAKIGELAVNHRHRKYGKSKYGLGRTLKVILDLITIKFMGSYSTRPLHFFGGAGLFTILLSFLIVILLTYQKFTQGISMIQSPLLHLSALLFLIGVQSILIGLLAEIMTRTYFESQNKPTYFIKNTVNMDKASD